MLSPVAYDDHAFDCQALYRRVVSVHGALSCVDERYHANPRSAVYDNLTQ